MFFVIIYAFTLFLIPVVIMKRKGPTAAIAYILAIIFLPIVGGAIFLIFGTERITNKGRQKFFHNRKLRKKLERMEREWAPTLAESIKLNMPRQLHDIISLGRKLSFFDAVGSNDVKILVDAEATYRKMEELICSAERFINLEFYIFRTDEVGEYFLNLLVEKAQQGVVVNFLYDALGSRSLGWNREFRKRFREGGVNVKDFLPLRTFIKPWNMNLRNHRKILVVDNKVGLTGSINIGKDFLPNDKNEWRETQVLIRGPAVTQLQWIFCEDWYFATGEELLSSVYFPDATDAGDDVVQVVASGPDIRAKAIHKIYFTAISQASRSIYLTTPYLILDQSLLLALNLAAMRGVDVRILVPKESDHKIVTLAGRSFYEELMKNNIKIYEFLPGNNHAKMLIVDGYFTVIGSTNADIRSFDFDFELNVQTYGKRFARQAENLFFKDLNDSRQLILTDFINRSNLNKFGENVCRLLSPLM